MRLLLKTSFSVWANGSLVTKARCLSSLSRLEVIPIPLRTLLICVHLLTEGCKSASAPGCERSGPCPAPLDTGLGAIPCPPGHGHCHSSKEVHGDEPVSNSPGAAGDSWDRQDMQALSSAGLEQPPKNHSSDSQSQMGQRVQRDVGQLIFGRCEFCTHSLKNSFTVHRHTGTPN